MFTSAQDEDLDRRMEELEKRIIDKLQAEQHNMVARAEQRLMAALEAKCAGLEIHMDTHSVMRVSMEEAGDDTFFVAKEDNAEHFLLSPSDILAKDLATHEQLLAAFDRDMDNRQLDLLKPQLPQQAGEFGHHNISAPFDEFTASLKDSAKGDDDRRHFPQLCAPATGWMSTWTSLGEPLLAGGPDGADTCAPGGVYEVVSMAKLRQKASFQSKALGFLEVGTSVKILECSGTMPWRAKVVTCPKP